eukprot:g51236.t1
MQGWNQIKAIWRWRRAPKYCEGLALEPENLRRKKGARAFPGNSGESEGAIGREQETKRSHEETQPSLHQEGAYSSPPPLVKMESSGSKKRVFIDLLSDSDDDRRAHKKKAKVEGVSSKEQVNVEEAAPTDEGLWTCERCTFNENPFNFLACSVCFHPQSIDEEFTPELATALQPASIKVDAEDCLMDTFYLEHGRISLADQEQLVKQISDADE